MTLLNEDGNLNSIYYYRVASGDFDIRLDVTDFHSNSELDAEAFITTFRLYSPDATNACNMLLRYTGAYEPRIITAKDGNNQDTNWQAAGGVISKLKITRIGTVITAYYFDGSWNQVGTRDLEGFASEITDLRL